MIQKSDLKQGEYYLVVEEMLMASYGGVRDSPNNEDMDYYKKRCDSGEEWDNFEGFNRDVFEYEVVEVRNHFYLNHNVEVIETGSGDNYHKTTTLKEVKVLEERTEKQIIEYLKLNL